MNRTGLDVLKNLLAAIQHHDEDYPIRNRLVISAVAQAQAMGLSVGFRIDPKEPGWPVAFIELPTGQVSWHLPQHVNEWDGHTAEEKYERVKRFLGVKRATP